MDRKRFVILANDTNDVVDLQYALTRNPPSIVFIQDMEGAKWATEKMRRGLLFVSSDETTMRPVYKYLESKGFTIIAINL